MVGAPQWAPAGSPGLRIPRSRGDRWCPASGAFPHRVPAEVELPRTGHPLDNGRLRRPPGGRALGRAPPDPTRAQDSGRGSERRHAHHRVHPGVLPGSERRALGELRRHRSAPVSIRAVVRLFLLVAGLSVVGYLVNQIGPGVVWSALRNLSWRLLLVFLFPTSVVVLLDTVGWRFTF